MDLICFSHLRWNFVYQRPQHLLSRFAKQRRVFYIEEPILINEEYTALHGKKSVCANSANEVVVSFENPSKAKLNIIIRAYNDGIAFRYEFPEK